jgi:putative exporter of polyketide antibiotics
MTRFTLYMLFVIHRIINSWHHSCKPLNRGSRAYLESLSRNQEANPKALKALCTLFGVTLVTATVAALA